MKKDLTAAFSTKALSDQESTIQECVDLFIERVGSAKEALDMTKCLEMISFDILGSMAFGESFHAVENGIPDTS